MQTLVPTRTLPVLHPTMAIAVKTNTHAYAYLAVIIAHFFFVLQISYCANEAYNQASSPQTLRLHFWMVRWV